MADDPILQDLLQTAGEHIAVIIRSAYEAGRKAGEAEARAKVLAVLGEPATGATVVAATQMIPALRPSPESSDSLPANAVVARPVREAMTTMAIGDPGASPQEVTRYMQAQVATRAIVEPQVRAAMKALRKRGDIEWVARGRYRPSARLLAEFDPPRPQSASTPDPLPAAEDDASSEPQGRLLAPKPNGQVIERQPLFD